MPRRRKVTVEQENVEPEVPRTSKVVTKTKASKKNEKPAKKAKIEPNQDAIKIAKIILSIQKSDCNNNKCVSELQNLYKKVNNK
jgi:hypothetical protein